MNPIVLALWVLLQINTFPTSEVWCFLWSLIKGSRKVRVDSKTSELKPVLAEGKRFQLNPIEERNWSV